MTHLKHRRSDFAVTHNHSGVPSCNVRVDRKQMKRREFITLLGGAAAAWPFASPAQQAARKHSLVGYLNTGTRDVLGPETSAFFNRLRDLGYVEGQNLEIVTRHAEPDSTRLPALAAELVHLQPDLI